MSRTQAYIYLLVILAILAIVAILYLSSIDSETSEVNSDQYASIQPYTEIVQAQLTASNGFQELVSYTEYGFTPSMISIAKNVTIRFTNNSHGDLWVAAGGGALYPASRGDCGSSEFDSCRVLKPGEFWEFMFTKMGEWSYFNNMDKTKRGTVIVQ